MPLLLSAEEAQRDFGVAKQESNVCRCDLHKALALVRAQQKGSYFF